MLYNLYELAEIYGRTVRYFQKKYAEFTANASEQERTDQNEQERTGANESEPQRIKKDNRTALKDNDLERFILFCELDFDILKTYHSEQERTGANDQKRTTANESEHQRTGANAGEQSEIEFLRDMVKTQAKQLEDKDQIIKQQNGILMATQKNMNDLLQQHNELKVDTAQKSELIQQLAYDREKTEESAKALAKLNYMIDDALMAKRLKDGIEFTKQLLKEKKSK